MAQVIDGPLQRTLRVGKVSIGLFGLDIALNRVIGDASLNDKEAAKQIFEEISRQNYVPSGAKESYLQAIEEVIERIRGGKDNYSADLVIRILGPGCVSCNSLQKLVIEIMSDMGVAADVFQVHDLDEIGRFGVMQTPALVINNEVKSSGRLPTRTKIEEWLREAIG